MGEKVRITTRCMKCGKRAELIGSVTFRDGRSRHFFKCTSCGNYFSFTVGGRRKKRKR